MSVLRFLLLSMARSEMDVFLGFDLEHQELTP